MKRCSCCEWIPILPWPVWPLAWQRVLGQNTVVGSMMLLLAMRGNMATRSMSGPLFALQPHRTTVWCGATVIGRVANKLIVERQLGKCEYRHAVIGLQYVLRAGVDQLPVPHEDTKTASS